MATIPIPLSTMLAVIQKTLVLLATPRVNAVEIICGGSIHHRFHHESIGVRLW
jgi:hypothetical protein